MKSALVIVAHPDDETIWMGGTILKNKNWKWTILSLCRKNDADRKPKFMKVCSFYGADGIISDLDDEKLEPLQINEVIKKIKQNLKKINYNYIFSHGKNGEYGHLRHREVHQAVKKMVENEELKCDKIYFFSYIPGEKTAPHDSNLKIPIPNKNSDLFVELNESEYNDKIKIITQIYGFRENVFETLSCSKTEAFYFGK